MKNAIAIGLTIAASVACHGPAPDLVISADGSWSQTRFRLMEDGLCVPHTLIAGLGRMRDNVKHLDRHEEIFDVDIEVYPYSHVFSDDWLGPNVEYVDALNFGDQALIKTRRLDRHVIAHELAHQAMYVYGLGRHPDNAGHTGQWVEFNVMLANGAPAEDYDAHACTRVTYN